MTTADVLELVFRRWYVVLLGLLLTAMLVQDVRNEQPVYWSQAEVTLINAPKPDAPNELTSATKSLIAMAGLVVEDVQGQDAQPAVSDRVDLPGLGVRVGSLVRLPNAGGQWEPNFNRPVVDVQVVAASEEEASRQLLELVTRVEQALDDRQAADGIPPSARIRATASVNHVRVSELSGAPSRAGMMTLLLGVAGSLAAAYAVDRVSRLRERRRRPAASQASGSDAAAVLVPDVAAPHVPVG